MTRSMQGKMRTTYKILIGKYDWKRRVGISRRRWEDNIETNLKKSGCDWINLAQWRAPLNTVMNLWVPYKTGNFLTVLHRVNQSFTVPITQRHFRSNNMTDSPPRNLSSTKAEFSLYLIKYHARHLLLN